MLLGLITVLLIGILLVSFINQVIQSANLEAQRAALEVEVAELRRNNDELRAAVDYAESDVNVERIAREQLGYAREGDIVVLPQLVVPTPAATPPPAATALEAPPTRANALRWWDILLTPQQP
ncbi:septum formation initiator family protein [Candidatus Gracilibacteria bacterium]|nr:septum formation initiator family protein [Candidatus Gracilibacteria bacterium]